MNTKRECFAITGATSFIGRHLLRTLADRKDVDLRLLVHHHPNDMKIKGDNVTIFTGDLLKPESIDKFLMPECTVINLVYLRNGTENENLLAMTNLAMACRKAHVKRLVHCSTAVVVGTAAEDDITEDTECHPFSAYEILKYKIENLLKEFADNYFELVVLRPTAVLGEGGKNLLKLSDELNKRNQLANYLKSCLFNHRNMNLVCVDNVTGALLLLANADTKMNGDVFIISDDDDLINNYRDIEKYLMNSFGYNDYIVPRLPVPKIILRILLSLSGKSNANPQRRYHSDKLFNAGFKKSVTFENGLASFADWYKQHQILLSNNDG